MRTYGFADWLRNLNEHVTIDGEKVVLKSERKVRGRKLRSVAFLPSPTKPVDLVIEGICSAIELMELINDGRTVREWPVSGFQMRENGPKESWLHNVLAKKLPKSVAIYAKCCGCYPTWYEKTICELFPEITFHFLPVNDLFDAPHRHLDDIAAAALEAGIIEISE